MPHSVSYSISSDNTTYKPFGSFTFAEDRDLQVKFVEGKAESDSPVKARYIKVEVKGIGLCPDWHDGVGYPAWFFMDEVSVYSKIRDPIMNRELLFYITAILLCAGILSCYKKEAIATCNYEVVPLPKSITPAKEAPFILSTSTHIGYPEGNEKLRQTAVFLSGYIR